jgi:uncharacterized protein
LAAVTLDHLRRHAIARTLFAPTTLIRAIARLGFVQADPIRAPARAQDLILRHRVEDYRAGDLERRYARLPLEEEYFINYGFVPRAHLALMHPRTPRVAWDKKTGRRAADVLAFVRERGEAHPRDVDEHFAHGTVVNYWGGSSSATTHLLEAMHYRGMLRVVRREAGVRVYGVARSLGEDAEADPERCAEALVALALAKYAPVTARGFGQLVSRLKRIAAPQLAGDLTAAGRRLRSELPHARAAGHEWYWPEREDPALDRDGPPQVRFLAPFDPLVWDRDRFELFWGWAYRFEAYTPVPKRKLGYYALPLLWRDEVIGWANFRGAEPELGYVRGRAPNDPVFRRELDAEIARMREFLRG